MTHRDHVRLIQKGVVPGVWADLGSGEGAFTLALANIAGPATTIYSIDKNLVALRQQQDDFEKKFPETKVEFRQADFTKRLDLPPLDGIIMANSLHFVNNKRPVLDLVYSYLKPHGRLILVEYNVDKGNIWVPYPLSFHTWKKLAPQARFTEPMLLDTKPSQFLKEIYSSLAFRNDIG